MKETQREDLTLYEDYADSLLYEKVLEMHPIRSKTAARWIFVELTAKYRIELPFEVTPIYLAQMDLVLKKRGTSLCKIVNQQLENAIKDDEEYQKMKNDPKFRAQYEDYLAHPEEVWD